MQIKVGLTSCDCKVLKFPFLPSPFLSLLYTLNSFFQFPLKHFGLSSHWSKWRVIVSLLLMIVLQLAVQHLKWSTVTLEICWCQHMYHITECKGEKWSREREKKRGERGEGRKELMITDNAKLPISVCKCKCQCAHELLPFSHSFNHSRAWVGCTLLITD